MAREEMYDNRIIDENHQQGIRRVIQRPGAMELGQGGKMYNEPMPMRTRGYDEERLKSHEMRLDMKMPKEKEMMRKGRKEMNGFRRQGTLTPRQG